jgi:hypothetical protein
MSLRGAMSDGWAERNYAVFSPTDGIMGNLSIIVLTVYSGY